MIRNSKDQDKNRSLEAPKNAFKEKGWLPSINVEEKRKKPTTIGLVLLAVDSTTPLQGSSSLGRWDCQSTGGNTNSNYSFLQLGLTVFD